MKKFVSPIPPLGLATIGSMLKSAGHDVLIVDQFASRIPDHALIRLLTDWQADAAGISCLTPGMKNTAALIEKIRKVLSIPVILGNIHATIYFRELLVDGLADFVVKGEGESPMTELIIALQNNQDHTAIEGVLSVSALENHGYHKLDLIPTFKNLDSLPVPAWDLLELKYYNESPMIGVKGIILPVQGSRGCPYNCSFCSQNIVSPVIRYRSPEKIVNEIRILRTTSGIRKFGFVDPYFPHNIKAGFAFCDELKKQKLTGKIEWITETRVDKINKALLSEMKNSGCRLVMFGFESGNQELLSNTHKKVTIEQAGQAARWCREIDLPVLGLFVIGFPFETIDQCEETIRFARELDIDAAKFNILVPLPGSPAFDYFKKTNSVEIPSEMYLSWYEWTKKESGIKKFFPDSLALETLTNLQKKAMLRFYLRPKIIFRYLKRRQVRLGSLLYGGFALIADFVSSIFSTRDSSKANFVRKE